MKYLIIIVILALSIQVTAQNEVVDSDTFIRVYDLQGKKINKGKIKSMSSTSLELQLKGKTTTIPLSEIGKIKTKRSGGNNILMGALIGGGSLAVIGVLDGSDDPGLFSLSAGDKGVLGLIAGGFIGSIVGAITTIFKKPKLYNVNGDQMMFESFRENQ